MDGSLAANQRQNRWRRPARHGIAAAMGVFVVLASAGQVMGTSGPAAAVSLASTRQEEEPSGARRSESDRAATATTSEVLNRQGVQGFESILAVAAHDIENPFPEPVNVEATRVAEAQAAATQTAVEEAALAATAEATQVAAAATATAEARAAAAAATSTAEARQAAKDATATAVAVELGYARATATAEAKAEQMAAVRATRAAGIPTPAAAAAVAPSRTRDAFEVDRVSLVSLALLPVLSGALGIRLWRRHKEPFLITPKPVKG